MDQVKKEKNITVKIGCDNAEMIAALDEVDKKLDLITAKFEKLRQLTGQIEIKEDC